MTPGSDLMLGSGAPPVRSDVPEANPSREGLERLWSFFDHVYVITIDRNAERRGLIERDLHGLDFSFLHGVDGRKLSEAELREAYDDHRAVETYGRSLSVGQIGCALSHRLVYQQVLERGYERVLILEDDARPVPEGLSAAGAVLSQLPTDWDLLYLYTDRPGETRLLEFKARYVYPLLGRVGFKRYSPERVRGASSLRYSANLRTAGRHWGAVAYAVTNATAARLLRAQMPISTVSDGALRTLSSTPGVRAFLSVPNLFAQRPGVHSSIWNRPPKAGHA